jgi:hypothetical protein
MKTISDTAKNQTEFDITISHPRKRAMLTAYRAVANVSRAAEIAGVARDTHYGWLRTDRDYAAAFAEAKLQAAEALEDEAIREITW